jgi:GT2 family glycosyltransferase
MEAGATPVIVIVAHRSARHLPACLDSLARSEPDPPPVIVVDNACPERSGHAAAGHPRVEAVVASPRNRGFADGANRGIAEALRRGHREVLLLNPDTRPCPGWLAALRAAAEDDPDAGILGALLLDEDGERLETDQARALYPYFGTEHELPSGPIAVTSVIGAAMWIRGAVIDAIGGLDPLYFLYGEEIDYCRRASAAGFGVLLVPGARVVHLPKGSQPARRHRWRTRWLKVRNDAVVLLKRPTAPLRVGVLDLPVFLARRVASDVAAGAWIDALLRVLTLPELLLSLGAIARSRARERTGPAHLPATVPATVVGASLDSPG